MSIDTILNEITMFLLVLFRAAGLMISAPLLGSSRIPKRVKALIALVLAVGLAPALEGPVALPEGRWELVLGIAGEIVFGWAMGMILSFVFVSAQWAGEIIGQQMGLTLAESFDPSFGSGSSVIGEMYYMLTLAVFLVIGGHRQMLEAAYASFRILPPLAVGVTPSLVDLLMAMLQSAMVVAVRLAAPMLVTMLVVDLAMGFISKTVPQFNVMTAGMTLRSVLGVGIVVVGLTLSSKVMTESMVDSLRTVRDAWGLGQFTAPVSE